LVRLWHERLYSGRARGRAGSNNRTPAANLHTVQPGLPGSLWRGTCAAVRGRTGGAGAGGKPPPPPPPTSPGFGRRTACRPGEGSGASWDAWPISAASGQTKFLQPRGATQWQPDPQCERATEQLNDQHSHLLQRHALVQLADHAEMHKPQTISELQQLSTPPPLLQRPALPQLGRLAAWEDAGRNASILPIGKRHGNNDPRQAAIR